MKLPNPKLISLTWGTYGAIKKKDKGKLLDVVVGTTHMAQHNLHRGEIGAVGECDGNGAYDVECAA
jgi:hypothetical protein